MPSMNDDVPARDAEGRTSFYAEETAQSLHAQLGFRQPEQHPVQVPVPSDRPAPEKGAMWHEGARVGSGELQSRLP